MSPKIRKIYFVSVILLFLVIAPILIIYSIGWRYNFQEKVLQKVGGFVIETDPRGAVVDFNGKTLGKKTPLTVRNILPGKYDLSIIKEGYYPWSKQISVFPGVVNKISPVYLLHENVNLSPVVANEIQNAAISANADKIAWLEKNILYIFDLTSSKIIFSKNLGDNITDMQWSPLSDKLLLKTVSGNCLLIDPVVTTPLLNTSEIINHSINKFQWSLTEENILYVQTANGFYRLNTFQKTATLLNNQADIAYTAADLYFHELPSRLAITTFNNELINQIPLSTNHQLNYYASGADSLLILDNNQHSLYRYFIKKNTYEKIPESVNNLVWPNDFTQILFYNNFELWSWDLEKDEKELIVRSSDSIQAAAWLKQGYYAAYSQKSGGLRIIEIAGPQRNTYEITGPDAIQLFSNKKDELIAVSTNNLLYRMKF